MNPQIEEVLRHLAFHCGDLKSGETALIVTDIATKEIGQSLEVVCRTLRNINVVFRSIPAAPNHGVEPPAEVAKRMEEADLIFGLTTMSMAHTKARLRASECGARYLSLPEYNRRVLESPALLSDFREISLIAEKAAKRMTSAKKIHVKTSSGTDVQMRVDGRKANAAPGWCFEKGSLASPPDAEVNIAPLESETNGTIVVDGSIPCPEFGLLESPLTLCIRDGLVFEIFGKRAEDLWELFNRLATDRTRVVAEFGVGLNPRAKLCGSMLEDEGCIGTVHFGIGSNATIGGMNQVPFHLDHIVRDASIWLDDQLWMENGKFVGEGRAS